MGKPTKRSNKFTTKIDKREQQHFYPIIVIVGHYSENGECVSVLLQVFFKLVIRCVFWLHQMERCGHSTNAQSVPDKERMDKF